MTRQVAKLLHAASLARQRFDAAEELRLIDVALNLAPDEPRALNARGMIALNNGDPHYARQCFVKASTFDADQSAIWINVATACRRLNDDEGEFGALNRALDIDRLNFVAQLRLAEFHQRRDNYVSAAQNWTNVVQMASQFGQRSPMVEDALARGQHYLLQYNEKLQYAIDQSVGERVTKMGETARRFSACIDHSLGRRAIFANECAGLYFPFLPADEFFQKASFPWLSDVEARTDVIRAEALALINSARDAIRPYVRMEKGVPKTKWSTLDGSFDWSACFLWEFGLRNDEVCDRCPETTAMLESIPQNCIPGKAPSAFFSILKPGAHIPPHTGVTNTRAIIHLPLVTQAGCRFRVGGETREWREGEAFAFDDTIEHEAWNDSNKVRIVLIFDVWNPHLTEQETELLVQYFEATRMAETAIA